MAQVSLFGPAPRLRGWRSPGLPWVIMTWIGLGVAAYLVEAVVPYYTRTESPQVSGPLAFAALLPLVYQFLPALFAVFQLAYGDLSRRRRWALLACLAVVAAEVVFSFSPAGTSVANWFMKD